jgi:hypothetical protein
MECGYEESLVIRTRRALQLGNERWRGEKYAGYPVNQVEALTGVVGRTASTHFGGISIWATRP